MKRTCLTIVCIFTAFLCFAQEQVLREAWKLGWNRIHVKTTDNCAIVLWQDTDAGDSDIYAQKLNPSGASQWASPIMLVGGPGVQEAIACEKTSDNNFVLLYKSIDNDYVSNYWIQKFSSNGQRLWGEAGVRLLSGSADLLGVFVVPNASGGAYIVYRSIYNGREITGQHIDSYGNQLWPAGGITLFSYNNSIILDGAVSDDEGGIIINVQKWVANQYLSEILRYSSSGTLVPLSPSAVFTGGRYSILRTATNKFALWKRDVESNNGITIFAIDNLGNQLISPVFISLNQSSNLDHVLKPTEDGGILLCYLSTSASERRFVIHRFNNNYEPMWGSSGVHVNIAPSANWSEQALSLTPAGGVWLSWVETLDYPHFRVVKTQYFSPDGVAQWGEQGTQLSDSLSFASSAQPIAVTNTCLFLWSDSRDDLLSLRRTAIGNNGAALMPSEGVPVISRLAGQAHAIDTISLADKYLVLWMDSRNKGDNIYYQLCDTNMNPLLPSNGKSLIAPSYSNITDPIIRKLPDDSVAILYKLSSNIESACYLQRVDSYGNVMYAGNGILITDNNAVQAFKMSVSGSDLYLGWIQGAAYYRTLMGQRIANGQAMWGENGKNMLAGYDYEWLNLMSLDDRYYCFTNEISSPTTSMITVFVLRVDENGNPELNWPNTGIVLASGIYSDIYFPTKSTMLGSDLIIVARNFMVGATTVQRISPQANVVWPEPGVSLPDRTRIKDIIADDDLYFLYQKEDNDNELRLQRLDASGNLLYGDSGSLIADNLLNSYDAKLLKFSSGAMASVWTSYSGGMSGSRDVYIRHISSTGYALGIAPSILCNAWLEQANVHAAAIGNSAQVAWEDARAGVWGCESYVNALYCTLVNGSLNSTDDALSPITNLPELHANFPNPFNPETSISFSLPGNQTAALCVYNLKGQKVKTLIPNSLMAAGNHSVVWNGCDDSGKPVGSGVYFYTLETTDHKSTKKMLLMK